MLYYGIDSPCQKVEQQVQLVTNNEQLTVPKVYESVFWDYCPKIPMALKTWIYLQFTEGQEINYILTDGSIIRMQLFFNFCDYVKEANEQFQIFQNLEQIKYLLWEGKYGYYNKKIGQWTAFWKGEKFLDVGGYYSNTGLKQGLWKELNKNYRNQAEVFETGEYINGQRKGVWKYLFENKKIGGGSYTDFGQKSGRWVELSNNFQKTFQVTLNGEYCNGIKVGIWNIAQQEDDKLKSIGFGSYDNKQNESYDVAIKIGKWTELSEEFWNCGYIMYNGEYKNGKKVGNWEIYYKQYQNKPFLKIGGGLYDQKQDDYGKAIKIGRWIELSDMFSNQSQVIYSGEYQNGKKISKWDIGFRQYYYQQFQSIGGGSYDENPNDSREVKIGEWIELSNHFASDRQVTYKGKYKNGKKVGKWIIYLKMGWFQNEQIGCEIYDDLLGIKIGRQTELSDRLNEKSEILYEGEYKENKKVGFWDISWRWEQKYKLIGGGSYGYKEGNDYGIKIGKWIDLSESFASDRQVIYSGEYNNGKKIGRWNIQYRRRDRFEQIGGGLYDEKKGIKIGKWIELSDQFCYLQQVIFNGEYYNGIKVGKWDQFKRCSRDIEFIKMQLFHVQVQKQKFQRRKVL